MTSKAQWYFDFISPFAYLQFQQLAHIEKELELEYVPILFAGLLGHWGHKGPAEIPTKRHDTYRFCQWYADTHDIAFQMPKSHPFNPLPYLRMCVAQDSDRETIAQIFSFLWTRQPDPQSGEVIEELARELGMTNFEEQLNSPSVKNALRQNTEQAIAQGLYGVPTLVIGEHRFWGVDQMDMLKAYLSNQDLFENDAHRRIKNLPTGIARGK